MTRIEAIAVLACFAFAAALGVWLILSRVWARRRVPERFSHFSMVELQDEINRTRGKQLQVARLSTVNVGVVAGSVVRIEDWLDGDTLDFNWPVPPVPPGPSKLANSRPWAHG